MWVNCVFSLKEGAICDDNVDCPDKSDELCNDPCADEAGKFIFKVSGPGFHNLMTTS